MAKKYLDKTGLARLWGRIQDLYLSKTTYENHTLDMNATINDLDIRITENTTNIGNKQNKITYGTEEPTGGVNGDVYLMPISEDLVDKVGDLSTLTTTDKSCAVAAINEVKNKHIITAGITENFTIETNGLNRVPITRNIATLGDKFTINNGKIVVGGGVEHVVASGIGGINSGSKVLGHAMNFYIYKNGTEVGRTLNSAKTNTALNYALALPPKLIPVEEGDYFEIYLYGTTGDYIQANPAFTYITLEMVS